MKNISLLRRLKWIVLFLGLIVGCAGCPGEETIENGTDVVPKKEPPP